MASDDTTSAATSNDPKPPTSRLQRLFVSDAPNNHISHMSRILSTSTGIDSTLMLVGYSLIFASAQLRNIMNINLRSVAQRFASNAEKSLLPGEVVIAKLPLDKFTALVAELANASKIVGGMCSDVRCFMRLWGLLGIWAAARRTYLQPPKDALLRSVAWGQCALMGTYLVMEHGFYMATKGVLHWSPERMGKQFRTSIKIFGAYLVLDYIRLWKVRQNQLAAGAPVATEKEDKMARTKEDAAWWKALQVNTAYFPLCFHWGMEGGLVSDSVVGLLGMWAGSLGFRDAWRSTA